MDFIGGLLRSCGLFIMNWVIFRFNWRNQGTGKYSSWIPLLGGVLGSLSIWVVPVTQAKLYWWVPMVIDYNCLIGLTHTVIYWAQRDKWL